MALSRRRGRSRFTLALLVLTSVTILTLNFRSSGPVRSLREGASAVFSPLRSGADKVFSPARNTWNGVWHYDDVRKENDQLRQQVQDLQGRLADNADAAQQLQSLNELNGIQQWTSLSTVTARVSSGPIANFEQTIQIDKGTAAGIKKGMPVVTGAGLLGRVVETTASTSVVKVLTDGDFTFGIRLTGSQQTGVARGTGTGNPIRIDSGIPAGTTVTAGELVTTAGLDRSIFPADIPVGTVATADVAPDKNTIVVTVDPLVDVGRLSFVRVLLWEPQP